MASFVGQLIECNLLNHELVRLHLIKPLTTHHVTTHTYAVPNEPAKVRAHAIHQLFLIAGDTLLRGLLESEDVRVCIEILDAQVPRPGGTDAFSAEKLQALREVHATWLKQKNEEGQKDTVETEEREREEEGEVAAEIFRGVETPVALAPQDLSTTIDIGISSPIFQGIESFSDTSTDDRTTTTSSPTLSISTVSDLTSTELDEDIGEERIPAHHEMFYLEDGNVEIVCGHTIFRVHSPIVSFSSPNLRGILSPSTLLNAPTPEGCPRIVFEDSAEDFAVLLKMIYTPGFPARHKVPEFTTFTSLLRMATKYGFSNVREGLVEDLKGAYPTKWEDFETAKVLGENVFGSPKPHPNAVLNLFLEQRIKFALPFAAYRAALGGFSSLVSNEPGVALPRLTLATIIYSMEKIRHEMVRASHWIVYKRNLRVCPQKACSLNVGINPIERRMEVLKKVFDFMVDKSKGDMLSPLSLGDLVCVNCARPLEDIYLGCRKSFVWFGLPSLLGAGGSGKVFES
ncbi:hypothetical protein BDM02DRAFT_2983215 [Thelephora ganbajun]|uniref:Uncharacterized protein n=1 Tax=Thelephora ganbajun TaxID=370292 RepID=A0ACB6ZAT1_THEGA|nr:hypothetical protein BDM02DRAFT_2983215 [Thelephora ganbajun]